MATFRETPYGAFNFIVEFDPGTGGEPQAGFSEVSGLGTEITVATYRNGNDKVNHVSKIPGPSKAGDVTLKRGVIGAVNIKEWIDALRNGDIAAKRDVVISLLDEQRSETVVRWKLRGAMPMKWTGPSLNAKEGSNVAMEELVLAVESIEEE